jgi:hypothetical protein
VTLVGAYLVVVVPLVVVMLAAVWRPRVWQLIATFVGPTVTALAFAEAPLVGRLGWLASVGVLYAFLVVPPVLPWRRRWARRAVPSIVLLLCGVLLAAADGDAAAALYLGLPMLVSVGALAVLVVDRRTQREPVTSTQRVGGSPSSTGRMNERS